MLKTSKDTFWKVMLLIFCKVLKGYKWTFPMVTAWKHTSVTNIFTTQEFKTFFCWSEAFSKLGSCPREICKVLSSPSPLRGYCGTSLSTSPLWSQAFHSGEGGLRVIVLAMAFFVLKWKFYFILQPETDPNQKWASRWDYILDSMPHTKIQWFR